MQARERLQSRKIERTILQCRSRQWTPTPTYLTQENSTITQPPHTDIDPLSKEESERENWRATNRQNLHTSLAQRREVNKQLEHCSGVIKYRKTKKIVLLPRPRLVSLSRPKGSEPSVVRMESGSIRSYKVSERKKQVERVSSYAELLKHRNKHEVDDSLSDIDDFDQKIIKVASSRGMYSLGKQF